MEPSEVFSPEAIRLLEEADYVWSKYIVAFKARDPNVQTTEEQPCRLKSTISYEEMRDHGLVQSAPENEQELGLQWLRNKLGI